MSDRADIEVWAWAPSKQDCPAFYEAPSGIQQIELIGERKVSALLWSYEADGLALIENIHSATGVSVCPILPNMATYARDTRDRGFVGAALDRLLSLPPTAIARIAFGAIPSTLDVLRKDFATGACLLAEMELARFKRFNPTAAFLNNQMADLAMAFDNNALFTRFARLSKRYGVGSGVVTNNFGHLAPKLRDWGVAPDRVIAPFNAKGYLTHPDRATCEAAARDFASALIASESNAGQTIDNDARDAYLAGLGLTARVARWPW